MWDTVNGDEGITTAAVVREITGNRLWAERYDRDLKDIFSVLDDVVRIIVATIPGRIAAARSRSARRKRPETWPPTDYFLRAPRIIEVRGDGNARLESRKAIALDLA